MGLWAIRRLRPARIQGGGIDRAVGMQHQPARGPRFLHCTARDVGMRRIGALTQAKALRGHRMINNWRKKLFQNSGLELMRGLTSAFMG
ncbi:MAG: hypothetical protein ACXW3U_13790 [Rhodoplanes sp.]